MNITIIPTAPVTDSATPPVPNPLRVYTHLQTLLLLTTITLIWLISLSLLIITYSTFTLLGYALLSISTIPPGHALSIFYASLIGGSILLPPLCITSELAFRYTCRHIFPRYRESYISMLWMEYVPRALIIPVFMGGGALGLKILAGSSFDEARLVDKGHLVAASALGGFIFQVIYEVLRALIVRVTMSCS